jgi:hypothetical protein
VPGQGAVSSSIIKLIFFFAFYKVIAYYLLPMLLGFIVGFKGLEIDGINL